MKNIGKILTHTIMKKKIMFVCLCALLTFISCTTEKELEVKTEKPEVSTLQSNNSLITKVYACQIRSMQHAELIAEERGYLENIYVREGQFVKKGQLLFQIMAQDNDSDYEKTNHHTHFSKISRHTSNPYTDSRIRAKKQWAASNEQLHNHGAIMTGSHQQAIQVRAPFDGTITLFSIHTGSMVEKGDILTTLSDNSHMWAYFNVPKEDAINDPKYFKKISLTMANQTVFAYTGKLLPLEVDTDQETGIFSHRAMFPNPDGLLKHGETGSIHIPYPRKMLNASNPF